MSSSASKSKPGATKSSSRSKADASLANLGKTIVRLRGAMTQKELARRAEIDVGTLSRIENGRFNPSFKMLESIAKSLGLSVPAVTSSEQATQTDNALSMSELAGMDPAERRSAELSLRGGISRKTEMLVNKAMLPAIAAVGTATRSTTSTDRRLQAMVEVTDRLRKALLLLLAQLEVAEEPLREIQALLEPAKTA